MKLLLASEDQKRERDRATFAAWGTLLTPEQYLAREQRLRGHPWARETLRTWLLCADDGAVLSSCETFRMDAFLGPEAGARPDGNAYAVASVYTEPHLRGRGHASRLLELLHPRLRAEDPRALAAVLYSDVGAPIYERVGYVARPAYDWFFPPEDGEPAEGVDALVSEAEVGAALAILPRPRHPFVLWPSAAQLDWHLERERAYAALLRRSRPPVVGARVGRSVMLWACSSKGELNVLVWWADGPREASALVRAARRAAARSGAPGVRLWEEPLPFSWPGPGDGGRREARDGSLPMIHPLDPAVRPDGWDAIHRSLWV